MSDKLKTLKTPSCHYRRCKKHDLYFTADECPLCVEEKEGGDLGLSVSDEIKTRDD